MANCSAPAEPWVAVYISYEGRHHHLPHEVAQAVAGAEALIPLEGLNLRFQPRQIGRFQVSDLVRIHPAVALTGRPGGAS